jgi:hypothetical protein
LAVTTAIRAIDPAAMWIVRRIVPVMGSEAW